MRFKVRLLENKLNESLSLKTIAGNIIPNRASFAKKPQMFLVTDGVDSEKNAIYYRSAADVIIRILGDKSKDKAILPPNFMTRLSQYTRTQGTTELAVLEFMENDSDLKTILNLIFDHQYSKPTDK